MHEGDTATKSQTFRHKNTSTVKDVILSELLIVIYFTTHLYLATTQGITVPKILLREKEKKNILSLFYTLATWKHN